MESSRDPLPAYVSAEPDLADLPPAVPRPRDPGESTEPLRLDQSRNRYAWVSPRNRSPQRRRPDRGLPAGDAVAYDTLYRRHVTAAHGLARQLVRNRAEADDVVAETYAKILELRHRGGGPDDAFRPYLLTAVRRAAYDPGSHALAGLPTAACGAGGAQVYSRGACCARPRRRNVLKPRIHCVLTR